MWKQIVITIINIVYFLYSTLSDRSLMGYEAVYFPKWIRTLPACRYVLFWFWRWRDIFIRNVEIHVQDHTGSQLRNHTYRLVNWNVMSWHTFLVIKWKLRTLLWYPNVTYLYTRNSQIVYLIGLLFLCDLFYNQCPRIRDLICQGGRKGRGRKCQVPFLWNRKPKPIKSRNGRHVANTCAVQEIVRADYSLALYSKSKFWASVVQIVACNLVEGNLVRRLFLGKGLMPRFSASRVCTRSVFSAMTQKSTSVFEVHSTHADYSVARY